MDEQNRLSEEDLERVRSVTSSGYNSTERKPFRGLVLLAVLWVVIAILGGVSWLIGKNAGYL
jgi:hypothetical protein